MVMEKIYFRFNFANYFKYEKQVHYFNDVGFTAN